MSDVSEKHISCKILDLSSPKIQILDKENRFGDIPDILGNMEGEAQSCFEWRRLKHAQLKAM